MGQGHDTPLGHGQSLCQISFSKAVRSYGLEKDFCYVWDSVRCTLDLEDMTMCQGHDTPLCHGQSLCQISSKAIRSYGLEKDFCYVWDSVRCALDLEDMTIGVKI